jgi:KDO2-lipid IV(A) lauroyltransferase
MRVCSRSSPDCADEKGCSTLELVSELPVKADLRVGGTWTRGQRAKNDAIWILARLALAATGRMPTSVRTALGAILGELVHAGARSARRQALANVALALPHLPSPARRALVRRCFRTLGGALGEMLGFLGSPGKPRPVPLSPEASATLERARLEGRGVIFASAHLGPWERVAASIAASGTPFTVLTRDSYDPRFSRLQNAMRRAAGLHLIRRSTSTSATRAVLRALRRGDVVGIAMDLCARVASCQAPFLGIAAPTALGPARMALRTGAAVVVGSVAPSGFGEGEPYVVTATRIVVEDLSPGPGGAQELTMRINAELSRRILAIPHAWVWMHPRWGPGARYDGAT